MSATEPRRGRRPAEPDPNLDAPRTGLNGASKPPPLPQPDIDAAIAFLRAFHPGGPWALVTFSPEGKPGLAQTFMPDEEGTCREFISLQSGRFNIYFSVAAVKGRPRKKVGKDGLAEVRWLHLDADLPKDLNWDDSAAVEAAKAALFERLQSYRIPPTVIVWSGGGFQCFWLLSEFVPVDGNEALITSIERRMQKIEQDFGADACSNVDRIMRLPGTVNMLSERKRGAGRRLALAELVEFDEIRIYDIEEFPEIDEPLTAAKSNGKATSYDRDELDRAKDALATISPDCDRATYVRVGMALKSGFGDSGFGVWYDWAKPSVKFDEKAIRADWKSMKGEGPVTLRSLFGMALSNGWEEKRRVEQPREKPPTRQGPSPTDSQPPDMLITRRNQVTVTPFPLDVLGSAAAWVREVAESKAAPTDFVALGLLVTASSIIGPKRFVQVWDGWREPSILWGALIGPPSSSKSPSMDPFRDAARTLEQELTINWPERQREYEARVEEAAAYRQVWERAVAEAAKAGRPAPPMPDQAIAPAPISRVRLWLVDTTTEQLARLLAVNPGGLLAFRDELAGLLGAFDRYGGGGSDRAFWLEAYGGRSYRFDRVGTGNGEALDIPYCAVSMLGGIQPDRLNSMILSGDDDGLASRVLYAWPDPVRSRRPRPRPADAQPLDAPLLAALRRLVRLEFAAGAVAEPVSRTVMLTPEAADEFQSWWERVQWDAKMDTTGRLAGAVGKLDGIALRLSQTLEFLEWAWSISNGEEPTQVSLRSLMNSIRIIDEWVKPNLARVFSEAALPVPQRDAITVGAWLQRTTALPAPGAKPNIVNARELRRAPGFTGPKDAKELDAALEFLVDARWLIPIVSQTGGRPKKDYAIDSRIYDQPIRTESDQ